MTDANRLLCFLPSFPCLRRECTFLCFLKDKWIPDCCLGNDEFFAVVLAVILVLKAPTVGAGGNPCFFVFLKTNGFPITTSGMTTQKEPVSIVILRLDRGIHVSLSFKDNGFPITTSGMTTQKEPVSIVILRLACPPSFWRDPGGPFFFVS
jgi:hypothetical protein